MPEIDPFLVLEIEEYEDGEVIFGERSHGDWLYLVIDGQVRIQKSIPSGIVIISTLGKGNCLGEMEFLDRNKVRRSTSAVAIGHVRLGVLDRDSLEKEYNSLSPVFKKMILTLVRRNSHVIEQAVKIAMLE